jgi:hypothetical protein
MARPPPKFEPLLIEGIPDRIPIVWDRQVHYRFSLAGGAILDMFAFMRQSSRHVVVAGQDALNPINKPSLPYFPRWSWYEDIPCSYVTFNDPTLYRSAEMLGGWCQYDVAHFGVELIGDVVLRLLSAAGLSAADTVLYGASAGGFWALMTGALLPEASVVVDISQTNLLTYPPQQHVTRLFDVCYPGIPYDVVRTRYEHRLSVARYYEHLGSHPRRIIYHQNCLDTSHVETQMRPFLAELQPLGIVDLRLYDRSIDGRTHCTRDKPGSVLAMLEPLDASRPTGGEPSGQLPPSLSRATPAQHTGA